MKVFLAFLITALLAILLPAILKPESLVLRNGDFSDLVWPNYYFVRQTINDFGQIPLWNPTVFSGIPEIANPQSPIIYPVNILAISLPLDLGIVALIGLHIFIAAIFLFLLGRRLLKWSNLSSAVLALGVSFSPFIWGKFSVGHLSQAFAALLLTPLIYFSYSFLLKPKISKIFYISIFLSLQYLNHPTIYYYTLFFGLPTLLYVGYLKKAFERAIAVLVCPPISILLILPIFLVHLRAGSEVTRSSLSIIDLAIPLWSITRFIRSIFLPSNLYPDNEIEVWLYPGIFLIGLGVLGWIRVEKKIKILAALLLLAVTFITLGSRTPIFGLLQVIPGFSFLRVSTRDWFVFIFLMAFLAGFGIEKTKGLKKWIIAGVVILDLLVFSMLRLWFIPDIMKPYSNTGLSGLFIQDDYRYYCTTRCLSARDSIPFGINTADGYHPLILRRYREEISNAGGFAPPKYTGNIPSIDDSNAQPSAEKLGKFAIKWVISDKKLTDKNFMPVKTQEKHTLYENKKVLPRIRFKNYIDNEVNIISDTPNEIRIRTDGKTDRLVMADSYYPGWEVWVDGKKGEILLEDGWARAVDLLEGEHLVEFKFKPF